MTELETRARRSTVLLASPSLEGHRLIYCRVLADIFTRAGHDVVVAGEAHAPGVADHPLLKELRGWPGVRVADTGPADAFHADMLPPLCRAAGADVLFCAEADKLIGDPAFSSTGRGALSGVRTLGLYVWSTNYQYRTAVPWWRRFKGATPPRRAFHERGPVADSPVDVAMALDERFVDEHPLTHRWMPDIYREWNHPAADHHETVLWRGRLEGLLKGAPRRPVVVYIGTDQERRGYDTLLRLAVEENAAFAHCGRRLEITDGSAGPEVGRLRTVLRERGALLETDGPYQRPETADEFLRAARVVALPYRHHDGSSGVMLQAVAAGRPVIVPDRGLMAFRTTKFGLGVTYADGDETALLRSFRAMTARRPEAYAGRLRAFAGCFAPARLEAAVVAAVTGGGPGAVLPQIALAGPGAGGEVA